MVHVKPLDQANRAWATECVKKEWGSSLIVTRGKVHDANVLPGYIAFENSKPVGLLLYTIDTNDCEIISLYSLVERRGIGTALINAVKDFAKTSACTRVWVITTNDNVAALRFYQKRGFRFVAVYPNALEESRKLKPEIPLTGKDGIPLRDEIELEMELYHNERSACL